MSSAASSSSSSPPTWANTAGPLRPAVEDHRGGTGGDGGMDELLAPVSTLDEPVKETIMRDVRAVGAKLRAVLIPLDRSVSLPECLCLCVCVVHLLYFEAFLTFNSSNIVYS